MPIRVDHQGYLLDPQGRRLDPQDKAGADKRWKTIVHDWKISNPKDKDGPDKSVTIMQVEKGDNQWDIAGGSGADERQTYIGMNRHHKNPHLIHPGDNVFVAPTTQVSVFRNGKFEGENNIDLFRDQQQGKAETGAQQNELSADAARFYDSVSDPAAKDRVFLTMFESFENKGDDPKAADRNRQAAVQGYLLTADKADRPGKLQEVRDAYDPKNVFKENGGDYPDEPTSVTYDGYNGAIDRAAKELGLPERKDGTGQDQPTTTDGGNRPASTPTDASGQPITDDPQAMNIHTTAAQSGGAMDNEPLKAMILDYLKVDGGSSQEIVDRLKKLNAINFGAHEAQVNDDIAQYASHQLGTRTREGDFGRTGDEKKDFIRAYLTALPEDQTLRQRAVDSLLEDNFVRGDYNVTRKMVAAVAEELGLKHNVISLI